MITHTFFPIRLLQKDFEIELHWPAKHIMHFGVGSEDIVYYSQETNGAEALRDCLISLYESVADIYRYYAADSSARAVRRI